MSSDRTGCRTGGHGFTLVELLVVIGIIALLISILLPAMRRAQELGRRVACMSNERQIAAGVLMFHNEWKHLPGPIAPCVLDPRITNDPHGVMSGTAEKDVDRAYNLSNDDVLSRYLNKSRNVFACPSNVNLREHATAASTSSIYKNTVLGYSYKVNNQDNTGVPYFFGSWFLTDSETLRKPKTLSQVQSHFNPKSTVAATRTSWANAHWADNPTKIWMISDIDARNFPTSTSSKYGLDSGALALEKRAFQPPHWANKPGRNYAFFDGHCEWAVVDGPEPFNP